MKTLAQAIVGTAATAALAATLIFAALNWALNCKTWDRTLWTEHSSCVAPAEFVGMLSGAVSDGIRKVAP